ncbi:hypothetical protein JOC86_000621 [Bacillus pakistanensis]|uniref:DUF4173 domain-containing protein n=1 Tax=Rossellomorea pakistanensis TaxID=992288 RepID=A0ABS2N8B4_9BACI|nr:DUF4173 domain-containing protein [Bacillus pakistanensis]MBM7584084.1 hypothetical protein [Bacillus pakistanensis]
MKFTRTDALFLFLCIALGVVAELCFLHGRAGVSHPIFLFVFFVIIFWRIRNHSINNKQIGFLLFICIWSISLGYFLYSNTIFFVLNILILPIMVALFLMIMTMPKKVVWYKLQFIGYYVQILLIPFKYIGDLLKVLSNKLQSKLNNNEHKTIKKIVHGLLISVPIILIATILLVSADHQFASLLGEIPNYLLKIDIEDTFRLVYVLMIGLGIFLFVGSLLNYSIVPKTVEAKIENRWDSITIITVLIVLNSLYVLFAAVQFQYLFNDSLVSGMTFSQYARRGFFELITVSILNWTILITVIKYQNRDGLRSLVQVMLSLLIVMTGIILYSAFIRMQLYEEVYGYTILRVLAHSFMIFLAIILVYTFIKVWITRLSLIHFYFITAILYISFLNVWDIDGWIVGKNLDRYERTGKIDIHYISGLSYSGTLGLVELYKQNPNIPELKQVLEWKKEDIRMNKDHWQSYNITGEKAKRALQNLDL